MAFHVDCLPGLWVSLKLSQSSVLHPSHLVVLSGTSQQSCWSPGLYLQGCMSRVYFPSWLATYDAAHIWCFGVHVLSFMCGVVKWS